MEMFNVSISLVVIIGFGYLVYKLNEQKLENEQMKLQIRDNEQKRINQTDILFCNIAAVIESNEELMKNIKLAIECDYKEYELVEVRGFHSGINVVLGQKSTGTRILRDVRQMLYRSSEIKNVMQRIKSRKAKGN